MLNRIFQTIVSSTKLCGSARYKRAGMRRVWSKIRVKGSLFFPSTGVKVFAFCVHTPSKQKLKTLVFSKLKFTTLKICTFLKISVNTYSRELTKQCHIGFKISCKTLHKGCKTPSNLYSRKNLFAGAGEERSRLC